jgi:hypothetical protein
MARSNVSYRLFRKFVGGDAWNRAFPNGIKRVASTPIASVNGQTGYIPPVGVPSTKSGNPWIDPATGKPYPGSPADKGQS